MASYVKTAELEKLIPKSLKSKEVHALTGLDPKVIWKVKCKMTEFTDYYIADVICTGLDRIADFHCLEEYTDPPVKEKGRETKSRIREQKHGISGYNNRGCRCNICKEAKKLNDYRRNRKGRQESNARYRAKLKTNAESN